MPGKATARSEFRLQLSGILLGYSLGTGVDVYLSEQRPVAGTVLAAPYDSLT